MQPLGWYNPPSRFLQRRPVLGDDGAFELAQQALLRGCLAGQHRWMLLSGPFLERLRAADARYFIVDREIVVWRGGQSACGQLFERLARDLGRWSVGHGGTSVRGLECRQGKAQRHRLAWKGWHTRTRAGMPVPGGRPCGGPAVRSEGRASRQLTMTSLPITPREPMWA